MTRLEADLRKLIDEIQWHDFGHLFARVITSGKLFQIQRKLDHTHPQTELWYCWDSNGVEREWKLIKSAPPVADTHSKG